MRSVLVCVAAVMLASCGGSDATAPPPLPTGPSFIRLQSEPGEYIGMGKTYEYTRLDSRISVSGFDVSNVVEVDVQGVESWHGTFAFPAGQSPKAASFTGITSYPYNSGASPGMSWFGEGRACNGVSSSFTVDEATFDDSGVLSTLDLRFEQHCAGSPYALRGTIHWSAHG